MVVTMMLLREAVEAGDKISVFSQNLNTLDILEVRPGGRRSGIDCTQATLADMPLFFRTLLLPPPPALHSRVQQWCRRRVRPEVCSH